MTHKWIVPAAVGALMFAAIAQAQTPLPIDQSELARQLLRGDALQQGRALITVRHIGPEAIGPQLRAALITALEREHTPVGQLLAARASGQTVPDVANPELIAGLAHVVAAFRDPRSIDGLAGALGTSPPASAALAEFGELAAPSVLKVLGTTANTSTADDALITLRFMAEGVGDPPITGGTRDRMRQVAKQRLTNPQKSITTVWRAIDLAIALNDAELRRIVQALASDRTAVVAIRDTRPDLIDQTQRAAAQRLAGIPPLPRHTSVDEFSKRWE